jgi:hypothetical protein
MARHRRHWAADRRGAAHAPLGQQFDIRRTQMILPETVVERVRETVDAERLRAPRVDPVQKRTVQFAIRHATITAFRAMNAALEDYRQVIGCGVNRLGLEQ